MLSNSKFPTESRICVFKATAKLFFSKMKHLFFDQSQRNKLKLGLVNTTNFKGGHHGNGPKSEGIFGNLLKANYVMNLF